MKNLLFLTTFFLIVICANAQVKKNKTINKDTTNVKQRNPDITFIYVNQALDFKKLYIKTFWPVTHEKYGIFENAIDTNIALGTAFGVGIWKSVKQWSFNINYAFSNESIKYYFITAPIPSVLYIYDLNQVMTMNTIGAKIGYRKSIVKAKPNSKHRPAIDVVLALGLNAMRIRAIYTDDNSRALDLNYGYLYKLNNSPLANNLTTYSPVVSTHLHLNYKYLCLAFGIESSYFNLPEIELFSPRILQISGSAGIGFRL